MSERPKRFEPGFQTDSKVVHFTRTLMGMTAVCGHYPVDMIGVPKDAELCHACKEIVNEEGEEKILNSIWLRAHEQTL